MAARPAPAERPWVAAPPVKAAADAEALLVELPVPAAAPELLATPDAAAVPFPYTGATTADEEAAAETAAEVAGLVTVQGQLVMVKVVASETVYVTPLWTTLVAAGQKVAKMVC